MNPTLSTTLIVIQLASFGLVWITALVAGRWSAAPDRSTDWTQVTPRRSTYLLLAFGTSLFVVYGGFLPFNYRPLALEEAVTMFRGIQLRGIQLQQERADLIATVLLWIPLAFFWMGGLTVDESSRLFRAVVAMVVGGALTVAAVALEFGQQWFPPRTISQNDVDAAALGAQLGVISWLALGMPLTNALRRFVHAPGLWARQTWILWAYAGIVFLYWLIPLDFTINLRELSIKQRMGNIELRPFAAVLSGQTNWLALLMQAILWIPVGLLAGQQPVELVDVTVSPAELRRRSWQRFAQRLLLALAYALMAETLRLFVFTRFSSITNLGFVMLGVIAGTIAARRGDSWWAVARQHPVGQALRDQHWPWCLLTITYLVLLSAWMLRLAPRNYDPAWVTPRFTGFWELPFTSSYYNSKFVALNSFIQKMLIFFPVGLLLGHSLPAARVHPVLYRSLTTLGLAAIGGTAAALEVLQIFQTRYFASSTDILLGFAGALSGLMLHALIFPAPRGRALGTLSWLGYGSYGVVFVITATITGYGWNYQHQLQMQQLAESPGADLNDINWEEHVTIEKAKSAAGQQPAPETTAGTLPTNPASPEPPAKTPETTFPPRPKLPAIDPAEPPRFTSIPLPEIPGALAIWGALGSDRRGMIWFGMSMESPPNEPAPSGSRPSPPRSARLFEYNPRSGELSERGDVLTALRAAKLDRPGISQTTIHTRIIEGDDGHLYFCSSDETGEEINGSALPRWGAHVWRLRRPEQRWEHLLAVPEALITMVIQGEYLYAMGYFQHVLHQLHLPTGKSRSVRVGAVDGHFSRNLVVDHRGHAFVPRLTRNRSVGGSAVQVTLVELDVQLQTVGETPLKHYTRQSPTDSHGIVAWHPLPNQSIVFATETGFLYEVNPGTNPATIREVGYFHPRGASYVNSLFVYPVPQSPPLLVGVAQYPSPRSSAAEITSPAPGSSTNPVARYDWITFDLASGKGTATAIPIGSPLGQAEYLTGSMTRDQQGSIYLAGNGQTSPIQLSRDLVRALQAIGGDSFQTDILKRDNAPRSGPILLRGDFLGGNPQ
jgi:VanZ family protein